MQLRKTITTIFMVPTLKIDRVKLHDNGFVNAYIKDNRKEVQYEDCIYVLFHPSNLDKFKVFLDEEYENTEDLIEDYDYEEGFVVLVYKLNPELKNDFDLIRKGRYSHTSEDFQKLFPKVIKIMRNNLHRDELSLQHRIFIKSNDLKEYWEDKIGASFSNNMEVWDGFDEKDECLDLDKLKNLFMEEKMNGSN